MKKSYYLSTTFNNIVFEGRNKGYGAYALRKNYSKHMALAAILATALFSGAMVVPLVESIFFADTEYVKPVYTISNPIVIRLPDLPKPPVAPETEIAPAVTKPADQEKTEAFVKPEVVKENADVKTATLPDQSSLSKVHIGSNATDGELPEFPSSAPSNSLGSGAEMGTGEPTPPPSEFIHVEEMPEFVGGDEALFKYLGKKMRYPAEAQRVGVEGVVVVTFVVAPDGAITRAEIIKGLGYGTDEEALRVINSMPRWKPGKQNGRTVPVRYTLPIRFNIQ